MPRTDREALTRPKAALEAIGALLAQGFEQRELKGFASALAAHSEIELVPIQTKTSPFVRHFLPLRTDLVNLLAASYRQYFKLGLAHPAQTGGNTGEWACIQLQPAVDMAWRSIRNWYVLACDGENEDVQHDWLAPSWLFQISLALVGVGPLKEQHVPDRNSREKLSPAHTRLLLKGARRVFLWELEAAFETVRNEEIAAAGAIPAVRIYEQAENNHQKDSKSRLKGTDGLGPKKMDLSRYLDGLTEKQRLASSLKYEYELGLAEIASRMEIDRKTAYEHIEAARRKMEQARSAEKSKARRQDSIDQ
jgi:hypothetical protein